MIYGHGFFMDEGAFSGADESEEKEGEAMFFTRPGQASHFSGVQVIGKCSRAVPGCLPCLFFFFIFLYFLFRPSSFSSSFLLVCS